MKRGQISFEYLIIVGVALVIIVPTLLFFLSFSGGGEDSATHSAVNAIGQEIIRTALDAYSLGKSSWLLLEANIPEPIQGIYISGANELVIEYYVGQGVSQAVFFSDITLTNATDTLITTPSSTLNPVVQERNGIVSLRFTSQGANVSISVVED